MSVFAAVILAVGSSLGAAGSDEFALRMLDRAEELRIAGPASIDDRPGAGSGEPLILSPSLVGSFKTDGNDPPLVLHVAPVAIEGLPGALYFEVARADSPWAPFRQGVIQEFTKRGKPTLRVFDFSGVSTLKDAFVGMWALPDTFPKITLDSLTPNLDLAITPPASPGGAATAVTAVAYPTNRGGAVEMTSRIEAAGGGAGVGGQPGRVVFCDRGFDAAGTQVWGPATDAGVAFIRSPAPDAAATKLDSGLAIVNLVSPTDPASPKLVTGGTLVCQFSFWLADGTLVESSRKTGRVPFRAAVPGTPIKGFDEGVMGMAVGERRRLIVPPELAYGSEGARNSIPAGATLIFEVECLSVENPMSNETPAGGAPAEAPK